MSALEAISAVRDLLKFAGEGVSLPTSAGEVLGTVLDVASAGYAAKEVMIASVAVVGLCVKHYPADGIRCTKRRMQSDMLLL